MKINYLKYILFTGTLAFGVASCSDDLEQVPPNEPTPATVYKNFANYKAILAKVYAGYATTGQTGPAGDPDILGIDEGFSSYLRQYFQLQELPTDEAVIGWGDAGLPDLHNMNWTTSNQFNRAMFNRIFYQVALCNEFIRETSDEKLSGRGVTGANLEEAKRYRAETRFLRALSYWHAIDLYGNVPFVTEQNEVGFFFPEQVPREELFSYLESELKAIENELVDPRQNEYGRADKAAAWTLLTKLYLNAEVYTGQQRYTDAVTYAKKAIDAGYTLTPEYDQLFLADNDKNRNEIIFPVTFDGLRTQTYGGTTFLAHAAVGGNMIVTSYGIDGGWGGLRTTKNIVNLFPDANGTADERANFHTNGQDIEIDEIGTFTEGYPITKYKNITSTGQIGKHPGKVFVDIDFPMFRISDVYLMYAEAVLRGGTGGTVAEAVNYINLIRSRAYNGTAGNITAAQLTLDFILDERARELNWEGHRRTDLIRYGRFTGSNYLWPWKGGVKEGRAVEEHRKLFPIPEQDIVANPNLKQNTGY